MAEVQPTTIVSICCRRDYSRGTTRVTRTIERALTRIIRILKTQSKISNQPFNNCYDQKPMHCRTKEGTFQMWRHFNKLNLATQSNLWQVEDKSSHKEKSFFGLRTRRNRDNVFLWIIYIWQIPFIYPALSTVYTNINSCLYTNINSSMVLIAQVLQLFPKRQPHFWFGGTCLALHV